MNLLRSPILPVIAWQVTCLAVLVCGLALRLAPVELTVAWPTLAPWLAASTLTGKAALVLAVAAVLLLVLTAGVARASGRARFFAELLLFFPLLLAYEWLLLSAGWPGPREIVIGLGFLVWAGWLVKRSPRFPATRRWRTTWRTVVVDLMIIGLPLATGLALGHVPEPKAGVLSVALYPLYALVQLTVFLWIPMTRLRAVGLSGSTAAALTAVLFALIHWPNPLVMLATLAGMLIWTHQFQQGRRLWQLAVIMGLTATTFSQGLPDRLTRHVRVGPGYVRSEAVEQLATVVPQGSVENDDEYLRRIYPLTIGRRINTDELASWQALIARARRCTWAYMFMTSNEYLARIRESNEPSPPTPVIHWRQWPVDWRGRITELAADEYLVSAGGSSEDYLRALYRDLLGREASPAEITGWDPRLSPTQRRRLAEVLLEHRMKYGQVEFAGMAVETLELPN